MLRVLWGFCLLFGLTAGATNSESLAVTEKIKIRKLARDFYQAQAFKHQGGALALGLRIDTDGATQIQHCEPGEDDPGAQSCMEELCKTTYCSGSSGREIAEACRGASGRCVKKLCETTYCSGSSGKEIAQACRGSSGLCVDELCKTTYCSGSSGREIAQACVGADGRCVQELCKTSYCSGSTGKEIARACAGN